MDIQTLQSAIKHFGRKMQIAKAIEEMGELTTELARDLNSSSMNVDVIDEIADVSIMIAQLKLIFGEDLVEGRIRIKLERLNYKITSDSETIDATRKRLSKVE